MAEQTCSAPSRLNLGRTRIDTLILEGRRARGFRTLVEDRNDGLLLRKAACFALDTQSGRLVDTHKDDLAFYGVPAEFR